MKKVAVFGSLKEGAYNHARFGMGKPLTKAKISGAMFLCYSYPHLYRPDVSDPEQVREHEVEIYELEDGLYQTICAMELGAGYQEYQTELKGVDGQMHQVTIFYSKDDHNYKSNFIEEYSKVTVPSAFPA